MLRLRSKFVGFETEVVISKFTKAVSDVKLGLILDVGSGIEVTVICGRIRVLDPEFGIAGRNKLVSLG